MAKDKITKTQPLKLRKKTVPADKPAVPVHPWRCLSVRQALDPEPALAFDKITDQWKALLQDEGNFCVYAAPLQELDVADYDTTAESASLWVIHQLKTAKGYWNSESDENWLKDDDSDIRSSD